jgi:myo-inositol-1(or 4)-monophosphatase
MKMLFNPLHPLIPKIPVRIYLCRMLKQTLLEAVQAAADEMRRFIDIDFKISNKEGVNNLVTEVDHAAEKAIIDIIKRNHPHHYILSEESGEIFQESQYKWIIDPIDGTVNFAHRIPICCISVGVEHAGKMVLGAVYNPYMNEFFLAENGCGATLNDRPIKVSKKEKVESACLVTGFPYTYLEMPNGPLEVFSRLIKSGIPVRRLGSAAIDLCWVACGRFDGFYEHKLNAWDSAAGFLVVQEAGGKITDFDGNDYSPYQPRIVATNGIIHDELLKWINNEM